MKKINSIFIIIFSTAISVYVMMYYSSFKGNAMYYEDDKSKKQQVVDYKKAYIPKEKIINNKGKVVKKIDEQTPNSKDIAKNYNLAKSEINIQENSKKNDYVNINTPNGVIMRNYTNSDVNNDMYSNWNSVRNSDYNTREEVQSVFKVETGKIEESLTTSDKIKLLYVSFKLGKENYKKVEEYLYAVDAEDGVLKALRLLKENLSEKEYVKVRKIAGKFIDMDAAERLK